MYYFYHDASALVKRYTQELGSDKINFLFANVPHNRLMCLILGAIEVIWVLVRQRNDNRLTNADFRQAGVNLDYEVIDNQSSFRTIPVPNSLIWRSMDLIESHSLNSVDAIVLRSALDMAAAYRNAGDELVLIASDQRLLRAAISEDLTVFNPETHPEQMIVKLACRTITYPGTVFKIYTIMLVYYE